MAGCCLRRTKEMQDKDGNALVPLPPVVINVVRVQLDDATREIYDAIEQESRYLVQNFYANGGHRDDVCGVLHGSKQVLTIHRCLWGSMYLACLQGFVRSRLTVILSPRTI